MSKASALRRNPDPSFDLKGKGDGLNYRQLLEGLGKQLSFSEAIVVTTLPRGSLQIAQPAKLPEAFLKEYSREFHMEDRLTWQAVLGGKPITAAEAWKHPDESRYVRDFVRMQGLRYCAAAPLTAPVFEGYPGAVHLYRTEDQGAFSQNDLNKLASFAKQLDAQIEKARATRPKMGTCTVDVAIVRRPKAKQFLFNGELRELFAGSEFENIDRRMHDELLHWAKQELHRLNGELIRADRVKLPDSRGDLWTFRMVVYRQYPAVGDGPFVLFCMQPSCGDWGTIRPSDFQADAELARLVPAIKFMKQEYRRGPTLGEIAKTVHLSPFHFHRRFTELMGLTPKHYLLECQIQDAKAQLLMRKKDLAQIAADCGFAHQSHFTSRFKQATGLTPTRWRRVALEAKARQP
jgi:AraC-like DNA-binding protein